LILLLGLTRNINHSVIECLPNRTAPYFDTGSTIKATNLMPKSFQITFDLAKDNDFV